MGGEIMSSDTNQENGYFSKFTLSLLLDSGFYGEVDMFICR